jgi:hypothetical protein
MTATSLKKYSFIKMNGLPLLGPAIPGFFGSIIPLVQPFFFESLRGRAGREGLPIMDTIHNPRFLRALFIFQATLWFLIGLLYFLFFGIRENTSIHYLIPAILLMIAVWLYFVGFFLGRKSKLAYGISVVTTIFILFAAIADDFGFPDLLFLAFNIFLFVVLILNWPTYIRSAK